MNERNPIYLLGKLVQKIEELDELHVVHFENGETPIPIQDLMQSIDAECQRLYSVLNAEYSPLHQFNELSREQSNRYFEFVKELENQSPERMRRGKEPA